MGGCDVRQLFSKQPYTLLRDAILAHPTMAEGLTVLFAAVPAEPGRALQSLAGENTREKLLREVHSTGEVSMCA